MGVNSCKIPFPPQFDGRNFCLAARQKRSDSNSQLNQVASGAIQGGGLKGFLPLEGQWLEETSVLKHLSVLCLQTKGLHFAHPHPSPGSYVQHLESKIW